ncbi:MAG: HAD-IA family hydrolase [Lachnospiraceae bacterium]
MQKNITTIIFDLDGTLLNSLSDLTNSVNYIMKRFHFPIHSEDAVRQMVGNGIQVLLEKAIPEGRNDENFQECVHLFQEHYELHKKDFTMPFPGVMDFLKYASDAGYKLAVVSNKFDLAVKGLCTDFFSPYITTAIGESAGISRKPAPDTVFAAMKELHSTPEECIYVGDSDVDIATARNSNIPCISVTWGFRTREFLIAHGAVELVDNMEALKDIIC